MLISDVNILYALKWHKIKFNWAKTASGYAVCLTRIIANM